MPNDFKHSLSQTSKGLEHYSDHVKATKWMTDAEKEAERKKKRDDAKEKYDKERSAASAAKVALISHFCLIHQASLISLCFYRIHVL